MDRIADTIASVKTEKAQIDSTITDIKDLREVISKTIESINVAENEAEEAVFRVQISHLPIGRTKRQGVKKYIRKIDGAKRCIWVDHKPDSAAEYA